MTEPPPSGQALRASLFMSLPLADLHSVPKSFAPPSLVSSSSAVTDFGDLAQGGHLAPGASSLSPWKPWGAQDLNSTSRVSELCRDSLSETERGSGPSLLASPQVVSDGSPLGRVADASTGAPDMPFTD